MFLKKQRGAKTLSREENLKSPPRNLEKNHSLSETNSKRQDAHDVSVEHDVTGSEMKQEIISADAIMVEDEGKGCEVKQVVVSADAITCEHEVKLFDSESMDTEFTSATSKFTNEVIKGDSTIGLSLKDCNQDPKINADLDGNKLCKIERGVSQNIDGMVETVTVVHEGRDSDNVGQSGNQQQENLNEIFPEYVANARAIFDKVADTGCYNFEQARVRVPSGLNVEAWKSYLSDYADRQICHFLEFGWPISFDRAQPLISTFQDHPSRKEHPESIKFYIETELGHEALLGPFNGKPVELI